MSGAGISVGICELLCQNAKNGTRRNSIHIQTHFVILPDLISKGISGQESRIRSKSLCLVCMELAGRAVFSERKQGSMENACPVLAWTDTGKPAFYVLYYQ